MQLKNPEVTLGETLSNSSYNSQGQYNDRERELNGTDSKWIRTLTHQAISVT